MNKQKEPKQTIKSSHEPVTFGQYRGETYDWILDHDPKYIIWLADNGIVDMPILLLDDAIDRCKDFSEFNHNYSSYYDE